MKLISTVSILTILFSLCGTNAHADCVSGDCNNGYGKFTYPDGGTYEGQFKNTYRHGEGTYIWSGKDKFIGKWKNGSQFGDGIYYKADGTVEYNGAWENGQRIADANGNPVQVCTFGNCTEGLGVQYLSNGDKYEGAFSKGLRHGMGDYHWANGSRYIGGWADNNQEGSGMLFNADGTISYSGAWHAGQQAAAPAPVAPSLPIQENPALSNQTGGVTNNQG